MKIKVGQTIRSYHFEPCEGRGECYLEGIVTSLDINSNLIFFKPTKSVWDGKLEAEIPESLREGVKTHFRVLPDYEGRLTILSPVN